MTATAEMVPVTIPPITSLRCDSCSAQAWIEAELLSGSILSFCRHHYRDQEAFLAMAAKRIIDYRPALEAIEGARKAAQK